MIAQPSDSTATTPALWQSIQTKLQALPPDRQQQVLDFVEFLAQKTQPQEAEKSIWDVLDEAAASIPPEELERMPTDGSYQHDHYLYGTPKREL
jgi:Protein of unknown function (DUF2281)